MACRTGPALFVVASLAGACAPAQAAGSGPDEDFQKQVFGRALGTHPLHACFRRIYDAAHLDGHPRQNVRTMLLLVTGRPAGEDTSLSYGVGLGVTFRGHARQFDASGSCGSIRDMAKPDEPARVVHCGVECDGGSIDVALKGANAVLVSIPEGAHVSTTSDPDDTIGRKRFGQDDKLFRLDRAPLAECLRLAVDGAERQALRRGE